MAPRAALVPSILVWVSAVGSFVIILPVSLDTKVMVTVILGLLLRLLQSFMGPIRRYSEEFITQYAAMAAYYLPSVLAFYTANAIWSSSSANLYWVMWSIYLLMFSSSGPIDMRRYSLSSGGEQRWRLLQLWLYLSCLQWGLIWTDATLMVPAVICFSSTALSLLLFLLMKPRVAVLDYNSNAIADYMRREIIDANVRHPRGKYPVVRTYNGGIIKVSNIVEETDSVTDDDDKKQRRDICLSYSFCQLLARRYFGFHCAEESNENVREFALTELFPDLDNYKTAFSIVEKQLAFLHDYFFTNYHFWIVRSCPFLWSDNPRMRLVPFPSVLGALVLLVSPFALVFWSAVLFVIGGPFGVSKLAFHTVATLLLALIGFSVMKPAMATYWGEIWRAFQNASPASTSDGALSFFQRCLRWCLSPRWSSSSQYCWQGMIGQYSLIHDYDSRSLWKAAIGLFNEHILSEESHGFIRHRPVEEHPVRLEDSVKQRVARTLKDMCGPPTSGETSLHLCRARHGLDFGWTLDEETHTHTILIWHIATCYCDMFLKRTGTESRDDSQVAVHLSRYCAYLVAFLPQLLPDHSLHTKIVLQQVLQEAKDSLLQVASQDEVASQGEVALQDEEQASTAPLLDDRRPEAKTKKEKRIQDFQRSLPANVNDLTTTFQKGIKLGQDLSTATNVDSWKLMADFWAETILYVAPSDNAASHIELLSKGGQFVTHVWALLSNAGIFKRATQ